ncbi:MAG: hypothetical protein Kow0068_08920 [Marinilabiliales bacterium]
MKKIILVLVVFSLLIAFITSCTKYKENRTTTTSADENLSEIAFNDIYKIVNETAEDESSNKSIDVYSFGNCATVTVDPDWPDTTFPKTVTIDFGTTNCTGLDGRLRRGKIVYTISDRYRNAGCVITVTPQDFYINEYKVEGTKKITNNGRNSANNLNYTIEVINGKVTTPSNDIITWESTRVREWIEGEETTFLTDGANGVLDDVYSITGSGEGVNRDGRSFTVTIKEPLIVKLDCRWITKGVLEIAPDGLKTRTIDYGDGNCDNDATVEIGNRTYSIELLQ